MTTSKQEKRKNQLAPRRAPVQARARERARQILEVTARLLDKVGLDDLTTILIAKELGISVGSLYHYFPNKHAILYALAEDWLASMTAALEEVSESALEECTLDEFVEVLLDKLAKVYQEQEGVLPLVQAMWGIPELSEIDERHDQLVITYLCKMFERLGFACPPNEKSRIARLMLETMHTVLVTITQQQGHRARRTREDLHRMLLAVMDARRADAAPDGLDDIEAP
ncbi:TetR/AcrR family transcriptional regulator [Biformimicrobium ophioploci]|uniref:TetR/AcrR family transcriptional regulator n=1 Tax=Biformimicrobium ophioploci TaxID=3036711 RepID=UPI00255651C7|nr:TetR/AcrR family transcriptional regulator [Microbulbifer sp. NKW57]